MVHSESQRRRYTLHEMFVKGTTINARTDCVTNVRFRTIRKIVWKPESRVLAGGGEETIGHGAHGRAVLFPQVSFTSFAKARNATGRSQRERERETVPISIRCLKGGKVQKKLSRAK